MNEFNDYNQEEIDSGDDFIPENEYYIEFASSSGPGGQNVNRRSTKAILYWDLNKSHFSDEERLIISEKLGSRLTKEGIIIVSDQSMRSQLRNKENVIRKLQEIINKALFKEKERLLTKPTWSSKERRIDEKKKESRKKDLRKPIKEW